MADKQIDVIIQAILDNKQFKKAIKQQGDATDKAGKKTKSVTDGMKKNWFAVAAKVAAAAILIKKAFDFTKKFLEFKQSTEAMEKQFGVSSDKIIKKLKQVSDGTVSNKDIVLAANRAMALGVTKDVEQMADLMEIARVRARVMGIETTQAFNDIVTGIGRGSPLILDNLGIVTKGWDKEAKAAGVAMDAQFILTKVLSDGRDELKKLGDITLTDAERLQKFKASVENLSIKFGSLFSRLLPIVDKLNEFLDLIDRAAGDQARFGKIISDSDKALVKKIVTDKKNNKELLETVKLVQDGQGMMQGYKDKIDALKDSTKFTARFTRAYKEELERLKGGLQGATEFTEMWEKSLQATFKEVFTDIKNVEEFTKVFNKLNKELMGVPGSGGGGGEDGGGTSGGGDEEITGDEKLAVISQAVATNESLMALQDQLTENFLLKQDEELAKLQEINEEKKASIEDLVEKGVLTREQADKRLDALENKRAKKEAEIEKEKRKAIRAAAIRNKAIGIVNATINTAVAIAAAIGQSGNPILGIVMAALVGAIGAAEIATIASQKIPALARGGRVPVGQEVVVGEAGAERFISDAPGRVVSAGRVNQAALNSVPTIASGGSAITQSEDNRNQSRTFDFTGAQIVTPDAPDFIAQLQEIEDDTETTLFSRD